MPAPVLERPVTPVIKSNHFQRLAGEVDGGAALKSTVGYAPTNVEPKKISESFDLDAYRSTTAAARATVPAQPAADRFVPTLDAKKQLLVAEENAVRNSQLPMANATDLLALSDTALGKVLDTIIADYVPSLSTTSPSSDWNQQVLGLWKSYLTPVLGADADANGPAVAGKITNANVRANLGVSLVKQSPFIYSLLPEDMRANPRVALQALRQTDVAIDPAVIPATLAGQSRFLLPLTRYGQNLFALPAGCSSDVDTLKTAVHANPGADYWASPAVKADPSYQAALKASILRRPPGSMMLQNFSSFYMDPSMFKDVDVMSRLIANDVARFQRADTSIRTDPRILAALRESILNERVPGTSNLSDAIAAGILPADMVSEPALAVHIANRGGYPLLPPESQALPAVALAHARSTMPDQDYPDAGYVPALKTIPKQVLVDHPDVAAEGVISDPMSLRYLVQKTKDASVRIDVKGNVSQAKVKDIAIDLNGMALEFAGADSQNDFDTVLRAVKQNGDAIQFAGDRLRADPRFSQIAEAAVDNSLSYPSYSPNRGLAFNLVPSSVANYEELGIKAGKATPGMLTARYGNTWKKDPATVFRLLRDGVSPDVLFNPGSKDDRNATLREGSVDASVWGKKFKLDASGNNSQDFRVAVGKLLGANALKYLPAEYQAEPKTLAAVTEGMGKQGQAIPPDLMDYLSKNPDVTKGLVEANHWAWYSLPPDQQARFDLAKLAIASDEGLVTSLPPSIQTNLEQMRELASISPLSIDQMLPEVREALIGKKTLEQPNAEPFRALATKYATLKSQLKDLGITEARFAGKQKELREVIQNRLAFPNLPAGKKVAVVLAPIADWDHAFTTVPDEVRVLMDAGYHVLYFENHSAPEAIKNWAAATDAVRARDPQASALRVNLGQAAPVVDFVDFGGHGSYSDTAISDSNAPEVWYPWYNTTKSLTLRDEGELQRANLSAKHVVASSCEVARFSGLSGNVYRWAIAPELAAANPAGTTYASSVSMNELPSFTERGDFKSPDFTTMQGNWVQYGPGAVSYRPHA